MAIATTSAPPGRSAWLKEALPVAALLACYVTLGMSAIDRKSMTFDEGVHTTGGYLYWALGDYRLHPENGNWSQRWAGLPLWLGGCQAPDLAGNAAWKSSILWGVSDLFLYGSGNDVDALLRRSRWAMAVPAVLLGAVVYLWSRQLFGVYGGLISLTLYAFSPTMLANSFVTTSDLFAALFFTAAVWSVWTLLQRITPFTLVATGLSVAGLLLSKYSGVVILPLSVALLGIRLSDTSPLPIRVGTPREARGLGRQAAAFAAAMLAVTLIVILVIWLSYGFRYSAFAPGAEEGSQFWTPWEDVDKTLAPTTRAVFDFARRHQLLPEGFLYGFGYMLASTRVRNGFLHGAFGQSGWTSFFPICLAIKTPLELFVLLGLGGWGGWLFRLRGADQGAGAAPSKRTGLYDVAPLGVLLVVYWWFAIRSSLNIGHRHLLPTYPAMFILAGAAANWFRPAAAGSQTPVADKGRGRPAAGPVVSPKLVATARGVVALALVLSALEAVWIWPHYLAYFNVLAGGPDNGYRWLVDSSLDWGQDLKELKSWLDRHPEETRDPQRVYLSYFGTAMPTYYNIPAYQQPGFLLRWDDHVPRPLTGGLYCISASMLQSVYLTFPGHWNAEYERLYQELRSRIEAVSRAGTGEQAHAQAIERWLPGTTPEQRQTLYRYYEDLRLGRLFSSLRQREPDEQVGHSILLYRLTDEDVDRALDKTPGELLPKAEAPLSKEHQRLLNSPTPTAR